MKMTKKLIAILPFLLFSLALYATTAKVYVTPAGQKYHDKACRTIAKSKTVYSLTVEQAKAKGYEPCKVCNP